jgi:hypothetical protein
MVVVVNLMDGLPLVADQGAVAGLRRWGICERHGPRQYDFKAYMELFKKARKHDLKVQAVMSFHAGGGNVGDGSCDIPLPPWVIKVSHC